MEWLVGCKPVWSPLETSLVEYGELTLALHPKGLPDGVLGTQSSLSIPFPRFALGNE